MGKKPLGSPSVTHRNPPGSWTSGPLLPEERQTIARKTGERRLVFGQLLRVLVCFRHRTGVVNRWPGFAKTVRTRRPYKTSMCVSKCCPHREGALRPAKTSSSTSTGQLMSHRERRRRLRQTKPEALQLSTTCRPGRRSVPGLCRRSPAAAH